MNDKQIEKLGFIRTRGRMVTSRKFFHPKLSGINGYDGVEVDIEIPIRATMDDILEAVYRAALEEGKKQGASMKAAEIRGALMIKDDDEWI